MVSYPLAGSHCVLHTLNPSYPETEKGLDDGGPIILGLGTPGAS